MIRGTVHVDIRNLDDEASRAYVWAQVGDAPRGVGVVLMVGTKPVSLPVVDIFRDHRPDLDIDVHGSSRALRLWVRALVDGVDAL